MIYFISKWKTNSTENRLDTDSISNTIGTKQVSQSETKKLINVPFMMEAPDGNWVHPWSNACEETVTLMVDKYYQGHERIGIEEAKSYIRNLFSKEEQLFGTNRNSDSFWMSIIINDYTNFNATVVTNPTIEGIKYEIDNNRPVISLHRGFDLNNPNIEFSPTLSSYHTIVIVGYDDSDNTFITHDPGDEISGENHKYKYSTIMNSLHDYNKEDNKTDGLPTVIFTSAKG